MSKILLKSNCNHEAADGVVRRKTSARYASVLLNGEVTGKNVTGTLKVFKKINNFKKRVATPTFYVMKWKWQTCSTRY